MNMITENISKLIDEVIKDLQELDATTPLSNLEKIRYIYIHIGKHLYKDTDFFLSIANKLGKRNYSFEKLKWTLENGFSNDSFSVICKSATIILQEALRRIGISSEVMHTMLSENVKNINNPEESFDLPHYFLRVPLENGTNIMLSLVKDIPNIIFGKETEHFAPNLPYKIPNKKGEEVQVYDGEEINIITLNRKELKNIDDKIGYTSLYVGKKQDIFSPTQQYTGYFFTGIHLQRLFENDAILDSKFIKNIFGNVDLANYSLNELSDDELIECIKRCYISTINEYKNILEDNPTFNNKNPIFSVNDSNSIDELQNVLKKVIEEAKKYEIDIDHNKVFYPLSSITNSIKSLMEFRGYVNYLKSTNIFPQFYLEQLANQIRNLDDNNAIAIENTIIKSTLIILGVLNEEFSIETIEKLEDQYRKNGDTKNLDIIITCKKYLELLRKMSHTSVEFKTNLHVLGSQFLDKRLIYRKNNSSYIPNYYLSEKFRILFPKIFDVSNNNDKGEYMTTFSKLHYTEKKEIIVHAIKKMFEEVTEKNIGKDNISDRKLGIFSRILVSGYIPNDAKDDSEYDIIIHIKSLETSSDDDEEQFTYIYNTRKNKLEIADFLKLKSSGVILNRSLNNTLNQVQTIEDIEDIEEIGEIEGTFSPSVGTCK